MKIRFTLEITIGLLIILATLMFREKGFAVIALYALSLFIPRHKPDERETQLYNLIGKITAGATLLASIAIYTSPDVTINHIQIEKYWLLFVLAIFFMSHGISGLIVFSRK